MGSRSGAKNVRKRTVSNYTEIETWEEEKDGVKIIRMRVILLPFSTSTPCVL